MRAWNNRFHETHQISIQSDIRDLCDSILDDLPFNPNNNKRTIDNLLTYRNSPGDVESEQGTMDIADVSPNYTIPTQNISLAKRLKSKNSNVNHMRCHNGRNCLDPQTRISGWLTVKSDDLPTSDENADLTYRWYCSLCRVIVKENQLALTTSTNRSVRPRRLK